MQLRRAHTDTLLDTREYEIELEDGPADRYFANVIADNLWEMRHAKWRQQALFKEIIDHRKNARAIPTADGYETGPNGQLKPK